MRFLISLFLFALFAAPVAPSYADGNVDYDTLVARAGREAADGFAATSFQDYATAYALSPGSTAASYALTERIRTSVPVHLSAATITALLATTGPVATASQLGGDVATITTVGEIGAVVDPQNGWPFTHTIWFYRKPDSRSVDWECYASVHYQLDSDQTLAVSLGRVLSLLRTALIEKTGYLPLTDGTPFAVWITRLSTGTAGEQWRNNIYFYDVAGQRSSIEWLREIAHEFSHLAFPILGGDYTSPEPWANGYYGERLLLRWIDRGAAGGPTALQSAWGATFAGYANFEKKLIAPALALYAQHPLSPDWFDRRDASGMTYVIGLLLTVDDQAGPKKCADLLWNLPQTALVDPSLLLPPAKTALAGTPLTPAPKKALSHSHRRYRQASD